MAENEEKGVVVPFLTRPLPLQPRSRPAPSSEPPLNVLVIDDTPEDRMAVRLALEAGGFVLQEASNAERGLKLAKASAPDCILLDYGLPDMEGLEVLEALRQLDGRLPCAVVMFSGSGKADVATAALKAGALDYLVKDRFDADVLRRSIRSTVQQFRLVETQRIAERRNAHLAAIVSSSSDAIISVGVDSVVQSWNPGAQQLFGYSEAEALGRTVSELIIPEGKEAERLALYQAVMSGKIAALKESERRRKDGSLVPVEINASPILDAFGRVAALSLVFRDISARRRAELALERHADRQQLLLDVTYALIGTGLDEPALGRIVFERVAPVLEADVCFNYRLDDRSGMLELIFQRGVPPEMRANAERLHLNEAFCGTVAGTCKPLAADAPRIETDPKGALVRAFGVKAYACHPLKAGDGRVLGTFSLGSTRRTTFSREDIAFLQTLSNFLAQAWERIASERALRESESFRRSVFEASPDCVKILSLDGRLEELNGNGRCLMEIDDIAALRGRPWSELWPPAEAPEVERAIRTARAGALGAFSAFCPTAKGTPKWWDVKVSAIPDADGLPLRLIAASRDISERRRADDAMRASEERYRGIFEHAGVSLWEEDFSAVLTELEALRAAGVSDLRSCIAANPRMVDDLLDRVRIKDVNGFTLSLFEAESKDVLMRSLATIFSVETRDVFVEELVTLWEGRPLLAAETRVKTVRGAPLDVTFTIVFGGARAERTLVSILDMTSRKRAEESLRGSEERFRTIVNTAQEGIWACDSKGRTILANPRLAEMLGTTVDVLAGKAVADFTFGDDAEEGQERFEANLAGHTEEFEFRFRRADGSPLHVLAATAPLRGPGGEIIGALGGFVDLTERKKAEERQKVLMRELAHRGKNLLAVVQSIAGRSLSDDRSIAEARESFIGRLQALSRTYSSLTDEVFEGALLDEIVSSELGSFGGRAKLSGPKLMLGAKVAQTFALIVHELATNAAKYGALSVPSGHLDIAWRTSEGEGGRRFEFEWVESGGPPAKPPTRRGFGSTLISMIAGGELKCSPRIDYAETGFSYRIDAALSAIGTVIDESPVRDRLKTDTMRSFYDAWAGLRGLDGALPLFNRFDRRRFEATRGLTIASIAHNGDVKLIEIGKALTERLGHLLEDSDLAGEDPDSMKEAYRRCARSNAPCYEHLRFDFGDGNVVVFERLLVPFTRGGKRATHIAGLVVFSGTTGPDHDLARVESPQE